MAFSSINSSDIQVGKPQTQALWQQVKDNFDALNTSLTADSQQDISGTQTIADQTVNGTFVITDTGSTFTLPVVANNSGAILRFIQQGNGSSTLQAAGAENINGSNTYVLPRIYAAATLYCDGDEWHVIYESSEVYIKNAGSVTAPTGALDSDPDTGFYWSGTDEFSITTGGTRAIRFNSAQQLETQFGSAASPTFTFLTRTTDGMYSRAANELGFSTNGVERFSIDNSGAVVRSGQMFAQDGNASLPGFCFLSDPDTGWYRLASGDIAFVTNATRALRLNSGQQAEFKQGSAGSPSMTFESNATMGIYRRAANQMGFSTNSVERFSIENGGVAVRSGQLYLQDGTAGAPGLCFLNDPNTGFQREGSGIITVRADGTAVVTFRDGQSDFVGDISATGDWTGTFSLATPTQSGGSLENGTWDANTGKTLVTGDSATINQCTFMRVGNSVMVAGSVAIDPDSSGDLTVRFNLPITSNFTSSQDGNGTVSLVGNGAQILERGYIAADSTNDQLCLYISIRQDQTSSNILLNSGSSTTVLFTAMYLIK